MALDLLNKMAPAEVPPGPAEDIDYDETGRQISELLRSRGWCTIQCSSLSGDVIVVIIDQSITGYPIGYPVYTEHELITLAQADISTMQLIHAAKKEGAVLQ